MITGSQRIVILTASVGGGHDGPAREIARRCSNAGHRAEVVDLVAIAPAGLGRLLKSAFHAQLRLAPQSWGRVFSAMDGRRRRPLLLDRAINLWANRVEALLRGDLSGPADVVVSTFPLAGPIVAAARQRGSTAPLITYITDPAAHSIWMSQATELYLATWSATASEIWRHGPARISIVPPAVRPAFRPPADALERARTRRELGLPVGPLALLTSGSWGVGNVAQAAIDLRETGVATPVVVCGHNRRLVKKVSTIPGLIVLGWTDQMPELMRACDVAVLNSGGLTLAEAMTSGLPVLHYRPLPGQGMANAALAEAHQIASWPRSAAQLGGAVAGAIAGSPMMLRRARAVHGLIESDKGGDRLVEEILRACRSSHQPSTVDPVRWAG